MTFFMEFKKKKEKEKGTLIYIQQKKERGV